MPAHRFRFRSGFRFHLSLLSDTLLCGDIHRGPECEDFPLFRAKQTQLRQFQNFDYARVIIMHAIVSFPPEVVWHTQYKIVLGLEFWFGSAWLYRSTTIGLIVSVSHRLALPLYELRLSNGPIPIPIRIPIPRPLPIIEPKLSSCGSKFYG